MDGARRIDDERNVPIARVVAAVFGDLRAGRIYRADLRDPEHVWVVRIGVRDTEELRRLMAGEDLPQAGVPDDSDRLRTAKALEDDAANGATVASANAATPAVASFIADFMVPSFLFC